jgi:hypothetical protein
MAELALDDVDRDSLAGELDRVRMSQLMGSEPVAHTCVGGELAQFGAGGGGRPPPPARGAVDDAEQRSGRQRHSKGKPSGELLEPELVHAGLAALVTLPTQTRRRSCCL